MSLATAERDKAVTATEMDPRWQSVIGRDGSADGSFVYAVSTTGVYCRPSCPSRLASPKNVSFFGNGSEAEAAGYRPCLRCNPDGRSAARSDAAAVERACRLIEAADELPKLDQLAAAVGMSPSWFHRRFKAVTGLTPRAFGAAHRASRMREGPASVRAAGSTRKPGRYWA